MRLNLRAWLCLMVVALAAARAQETQRDAAGFTLEERTRWEERYGVNFGKDVDQQDMLSRLRLGVEVRPVEWLRIVASGQDSRVLFYGLPPPNTMRDTTELQEAYVEFFAARKTGFGASFGREMLNYGEARLIGVPQWTNVARTYDGGRLYYRTTTSRFEVLLLSPVKVLPDRFNTPDLGERVWGTYNTFAGVWHGSSADLYALRHSQNRIGGWAGAGTLGTNTFGGRFYGPLPRRFTYSLEGAAQTGHLGLVPQRAYAWFVGVSRTVTVLDRPLDLSVEYKLASGASRAAARSAAARSATFDQLFPANHDKFGHEDLFGWRNLKTFKSLETFHLSAAFALNVMYTNHWLSSASDALYNSQGKAIAASKQGIAGTHVGQELDSFVTYQHGGHLAGAGFGHFFKGGFVAQTTHHVDPRYFYLFQQYSFR